MADLFFQPLQEGAGTPIVLSHALGLDHRMWASSLAVWQGRTVAAYDHRGHGRSHVPPGPYRMVDLVDDAEALVTAWARGPVIWVGLSLGGMVGLGLAIRRPDLVRVLVVAHSTAHYPAAARVAWQQRIERVRAGGMSAVAELVMQRYLTEEARQAKPEVVAQLREQVLSTDAKGYIACCEAIAGVDWLGDLHRITCPTLVIAGEQDAGATPAMARDINDRIAHSRLEVITGASHLSPVERPEAFRDCVGGFLASLDPIVGELPIANCAAGGHAA